MVLLFHRCAFLVRGKPLSHKLDTLSLLGYLTHCLACSERPRSEWEKKIGVGNGKGQKYWRVHERDVIQFLSTVGWDGEAFPISLKFLLDTPQQKTFTFSLFPLFSHMKYLKFVI